MNSKLQRRLAVGTTFAATGILATSIAVAAWTATGSGDATAAGGQPTTLGVAGVTADVLYPTTSADVTVTVTNPNPYDVTISAIDFADTTTTTSGCNAASVVFADQSGLSFLVEAGESSDITFTDGVAMSNAANDDCQGAAFTAVATASGLSS